MDHVELWVNRGAIRYAGIVEPKECDGTLEITLDDAGYFRDYIVDPFVTSIHLLEVPMIRWNRKHYRQVKEVGKWKRFYVGTLQRSFVDDSTTFTVTLREQDKIEPAYLNGELLAGEVRMAISESAVYWMRARRVIGNWLSQFDPTQY